MVDLAPIVRVERGQRLHQRHRSRPVHGARLLKPVRHVFHDDKRERLGLDGLVRGDFSAKAVVDLKIMNSYFKLNNGFKEILCFEISVQLNVG